MTAAHMFSLDGYQWHTTPVQPYGTQILLSDGTNLTVATRERPKIYFDGEGRMTHLFNGVSALSSCWDASDGTADGSATAADGPSTAADGSTIAADGFTAERLQAPPPAVFPPAAAGWQRFLYHCMSEQPCTAGCNCASHAFIRNFSQCNKHQPYPHNCYRYGSIYFLVLF